MRKENSDDEQMGDGTGIDLDLSQCGPADLDLHAVASVFKSWLRERGALSSSICPDDPKITPGRTVFESVLSNSLDTVVDSLVFSHTNQPTLLTDLVPSTATPTRATFASSVNSPGSLQSPSTKTTDLTCWAS
ncbi:hypothetical protein BT69DRAFT_1044703 [Atractiella rhizophila]|nr:hypothetical protein BT69DRAFT_1044703 [Atractiella rhizophila]